MSFAKLNDDHDADDDDKDNDPFTGSNGLKFRIILRLNFTQACNILKSPEPRRVTCELTE